jgi:hypothetical protein
MRPRSAVQAEKFDNDELSAQKRNSIEESSIVGAAYVTPKPLSSTFVEIFLTSTSGS